ncbi:MAG: methenyltetrahydromethanopterin cyclohydrolase [Candidatus Thorarchaeota archaeon]|nr:methenyltetrahydromethanopterin cyclohydrolase [Candidatus Thorarchaeota archaeon]
MPISVNRQAMEIVQTIIKKHRKLGCEILELENGCTIIDAGINTQGSRELGRLVGEVCLGGLGVVRFTEMHIEDLTLPAVSVNVDQPAIATLGSQYAGWSLKMEGFFAMASGPARALSRVETSLFEELQYTDDAREAVIMLETAQIPNEEVTATIAEKCGIDTSNLYCIIAPTASIVGSVQISARIVEVGVHKLHTLGFDPLKIRKAHGVAPVAPVAKKDSRAMGVTNDCILYGGRTFLFIETDENDNLEELVERCPATASEQYGVPFYNLLKSKNFDFYELDPLLFSPAEVTLIDYQDQKAYTAGFLNAAVLKQSIDSCK